MQEHVVSTDHRTATFNRRHPPATAVEPDDIVTFETGDVAYERLHNGESVEDIGLETFNMVTGPVAVKGAEPGDALVIDILDVKVRRAWSVWMPAFGGLGERTDATRTREIEIDGNSLRISDDLSVPLEPMIGCIGVAPAEGEGSTFQPSYPFGGNMDLRELSPGATLRLPVEVDGGLLSVGDLHAAMGRAEPTWVAIEAAGSARLHVDVEKGAAPPTPRIRVGNMTLCMGIGPTLEEAHQSALDQAYELLMDEHGLSAFDAYAYASARVGMRFGGPCGPIVMAEVPDPA